MKTCDLVMKGGITSGLVYPRAVLELSKEYRFANIGGTSAGALAAAITAAAEWRRHAGGGSAGFEAIASLPAWMGENVGGRSRLVGLFAPSGATRPLFEAVLAAVGGEGSRVFGVASAIVKGFPRYGSMVAAAGAVWIALLVWAAAAVWDESRTLATALVVVLLVLLALTAVAVVVASCVEAARFSARVLPAQGFGICSGIDLTTWLADEIDRVAGVSGKPVTFGDLHQAGIHLHVMTTNLTLGRPHRMPMETRRYYFDEAKLRTLFPPRIVQWMVDHGGRPMRNGLHPLPMEEMPIVVAARMSLSFPLLLSAVPLYAVDYRRTGDKAPEVCWFSDGGITSNFPVHFFDAALPRWPTFAINLARREKRYHATDESIYMPSNNREGILEWWAPFETLPGFLSAIVSTMQNWRDNMLLRLPGQRDRIAHVLLADDEGGLNLSMDPATIERVAHRGASAGRALRERFHWRNHRWVRYLSFMGALEESLQAWERAFDEELVTGDAPLPSYKMSGRERATISRTSIAFLRHVREHFKDAPFRTPAKRPRPMPVMRAMPPE